MEIRNALELVEVEYSNGNKKATMTFIDRERMESRQVVFNKQVYRDGKFVDDAEKAEKVEGWCKDMFSTTFDNLGECVGITKDVYVYDRFNSLFEVSTIAKFTADQLGEVYTTEIKEIVIDNTAIRIRYDIDGNTYESKMTFATYLKATGEWFVDPNKRDAQYKKFEEKFGVKVDDYNLIVGHKLIVEVKSAFGSNYYGDLKKFAKK